MKLVNRISGGGGGGRDRKAWPESGRGFDSSGVWWDRGMGVATSGPRGATDKAGAQAPAKSGFLLP